MKIKGDIKIEDIAMRHSYAVELPDITIEWDQNEKVKLYATEECNLEETFNFDFVLGELWDLIVWLEYMTERGYSVSEKIETLRFHMSANPTELMRTIYSRWMEDTRKLTKLPLEDRIERLEQEVRELKD